MAGSCPWRRRDTTKTGRPSGGFSSPKSLWVVGCPVHRGYRRRLEAMRYLLAAFHFVGVMCDKNVYNRLMAL